MTISLVATLLRADSHSPLISATGTTTGATLMWQAHTVDSGALVDDINATSPVNTYTALTQAQENTGPVVVRSGYNAAPTVGALHSVVAPIFFAGLGGLAFSGTHAAPLDGSPTVATVASSGTSLATGSKTPSVGGCLVISKIAWFGSPGTVTPPAGYTLALDLSAYSNLNKMAVAIKFKSAGDTSSENPTWGWTSATQAAGGTQVFKPEPVAPVLTGDITTAEAAASGALSTGASLLTGDVTTADAAPTGTLGLQFSTVASLPFTRNPGNGGRLVNLPNIAVAVLADDANLARLAGSAGLLMAGDGRVTFANGVPVPPGSSVILVTREPGAGGALGIDRLITT